MDTKTLFTVVLVAGIVGGFALNNSLFRDMTGLDDTIEVGTEAPDFTLVSDIRSFRSFAIHILRLYDPSASTDRTPA